MTNQQVFPDALRLANSITWMDTFTDLQRDELDEAAAELRRLHAENITLQAGYAAARLEIESLQARSVEPSGEYPELPEPVFESWARGGLIREAGFTAEQMRAYADAACAMRTTQPAPQQEAQEPVAWYVTGCGRLLDEDEAKAEARHIGGTARAIPLYTAPQADSQPAVDALAEAEYFIDNPSAWSNFDQRASDAIAAVCKAFRAARAQADSVLEDAARLDWLDEDDGDHVSKVGKTWYTRPAYGRPYRKHKNLRAAIDAARAAQEGKSHDN